ncbi:MAG: hypothetical protein AAF840_03315 [Bacteroidota bacterium]
MKIILSICLALTFFPLRGQRGLGPLKLYSLERSPTNLNQLREQYPNRSLAFIFWRDADFPSTKLLLDLSSEFATNGPDSNTVFFLVQAAGKLNLRRYRSSGRLNREIEAGQRTVARLFGEQQQIIHLLDLYSNTSRRIVLGDKPKFPAALLFDEEGNLIIRQTKRGVSWEVLRKMLRMGMP